MYHLWLKTSDEKLLMPWLNLIGYILPFSLIQFVCIKFHDQMKKIERMTNMLDCLESYFKCKTKLNLQEDGFLCKI